MNANSAASRLIDIAFALVGLCVSLPILCLFVPLLVIIDGLPIFFTQQRVGLHGVLFRIYKLRTMQTDEETDLTETGERVHTGQDGQARVTSFGRFLRKTKVDELPQFLNLLRGDIALVGPRAQVMAHVNALDDKYKDAWAKVHSVKPGLTDPATIHYIDEETELLGQKNSERYYQEHILPHKLAMYHQYIDNKSLIGDMRIVAQTAYAIVRHWVNHARKNT